MLQLLVQIGVGLNAESPVELRRLAVAAEPENGLGRISQHSGQWRQASPPAISETVPWFGKS